MQRRRHSATHAPPTSLTQMFSLPSRSPPSSHPRIAVHTFMRYAFGCVGASRRPPPPRDRAYLFPPRSPSFFSLHLDASCSLFICFFFLVWPCNHIHRVCFPSTIIHLRQSRASFFHDGFGPCSAWAIHTGAPHAVRFVSFLPCTKLLNSSLNPLQPFSPLEMKRIVCAQPCYFAWTGFYGRDLFACACLSFSCAR